MRSSSLATHALPRLVQPAAYGLKLITTPGRGTGIEAARRTISSASTLQQIPCSSLQLGVAVQSDHFETANPAETIYRVRNCAGVHASSAGLLEQLRSVNTWARGKKMSGIGVDTLPVLPTDPGDRNRTSPFAFTGNRFEFRAPGSMQTVAGPMVMINTIMAEALNYCASQLETAVTAGTESTPRCKTCSRRSSPPTPPSCSMVRILRQVADRSG
jgi:hypothetical protein